MLLICLLPWYANAVTYIPIKVGDITVIIPVNFPPEAVADQFNINEDDAVDFDVLANDSDDGVLANATLQITAPPTYGTAEVVAGKIRYTPTSNYHGVDSLSYSITDEGGEVSNIVTVSFNVLPVNDAPELPSLPNQTLSEDSSLSVTVTASDIDSPQSAMSFSCGSSNPNVLPCNHSNFSGSGFIRTLTLVPVANASGTASITVTVGDGDKTTATSFVVNVSAVNDPPVLQPVTGQSLSEDSSRSVIVSASDIDSPQSAIGFACSSNNPGVLPCNQNNFSGSGFSRTLTLIPLANASGTARITVTVTDGDKTATTHFTVNVSAVNDAPVAMNDTAQANENMPVLIDVLANDSDVDNDPLTITSATVTAGSGSAQITSDNKIQFTPTANFSGTATIHYGIRDPGGANASAVVTVTVIKVNRPPDIQGAPATHAIANGFYSFTPTITDPDGDPLSVSFTGLPGWLSGNSQTGVLTGTPRVQDIGSSNNIGIIVSDGNSSNELNFVLSVVAGAVTVDLISPSHQEVMLHGAITVSASVSDEQQTKRVEFRHNSGAWQTDSDNAFPWEFRFSNILIGNNTFQARVTNTSDVTAMSAVIQVTVLLATPDITIERTDLQVPGDFDVSWDPVSGASSYTLQERVGDGQWTTIATQSQTLVSFVGKTPQSYSYRVRATGNGISGDWSFVKTHTVGIEVGQCPVE